MSEYVYATNGNPLSDAEGSISLPREKITRCRDCRYYYPHDRVPVCYRLYEDVYVEPNDFCKWGERK